MFSLSFLFVLIFSSVTLTGCNTLKKSELSQCPVLLEERFDSDLENWWVEGSEKVRIQDGRLYIDANNDKTTKGKVCTVWYKKPFEADNLTIEFDAHVIKSKLECNNINFFLFYTHPGEKTMYETRHARSSGAYKLYHNLNGYIFTYLRDWHKKEEASPGESAKARFRIRKCPGFQLSAENFAYHNEVGQTYRIAITKKGNKLTYSVDGKVFNKWHDPEPLKFGYIGLRTFMTYLWIDNIIVKSGCNEQKT
jgi:Domain of unknown function (DUF1961)